MPAEHSLDLNLSPPLDRVVTYTATALFALTIVLATIQVGVRIFNVSLSGVPLHWTEPLARFVLIVGTYLGAAVASRNNEHIKMEIIINWVKDRNRTTADGLNIIASVIIVGFLLITLRGTIGLAESSWGSSFGSVSIVTSGMLYAGISVGIGLMAFYESQILVQTVRNRLGSQGDN